MEKREVSGFVIFALSFAIDGSPMICLISSSNRCLNGETTMHYFQVMSEPLMLSQSFRQRFFNVLGKVCYLETLNHFAVNVKKCEKTEIVTVSSRGNRWTYFDFSVSLNEMHYGESLGWATLVNI